jgi:ribokinase
VNADFQTRVGGAIEGRTSLGTQFARLGGGKAGNVAFLARRLGVSARLLAHVGDDELQEQALRPLRTAGVDLSAVASIRGQQTAVAMIAVAANGTKSIVLANNANDAWTDSDALAAANSIRDAPDGCVLVADCEVPAFVVRAAVRSAKARGFPIIIDPSFPDRVEHELLPVVTAITPDPAEAQALTGIEVSDLAGAARAAERIAHWRVPIVCAKLADGGCVLAHGSALTVVPSLHFERVDSTGAGDAFAGALAVALLEQRPVLQAVCFGVAAAHVSVTRYGSQASYPTREEIDTLLPLLLGKVHALEAA